MYKVQSTHIGKIVRWVTAAYTTDVHSAIIPYTVALPIHICLYKKSKCFCRNNRNANQKQAHDTRSAAFNRTFTNMLL